MAGYWEGFTEKELGFYLRNNEEEKGSEGMREGSKLLGRRQKSSRGKAKSAERAEGMTIPEEARLCTEVREDVQPASEESDDQKTVISGTSQPVCLKVIDGNAYELVEKDPRTVSPETLEVFQARQKMLEEQNKRKKEMLAKVLDDRRKQTTEEAKRLKNIQDELHKLDLILSNDVGILRNQIESASIEFGEAQKRYNKAEKEYLEAKSTLFSKLERKEMLTKHLCTIIEQNEMRKAQKLSELMEKLRINENGAKYDSNAVIISPYYESALKEEESGNVNSGYETQQPAKVNTS
ncbi:UNVERIFIED_CONTAM: hypothetical protein PYX00_001311 [Menopon gallinae]|uniref:RAB6-interacting golgin n=1 Tax=Menopon gallinae TaxID=328185 RepID=A0AAW2ICC2_9NEOP